MKKYENCWKSIWKCAPDDLFTLCKWWHHTPVECWL